MGKFVFFLHFNISNANILRIKIFRALVLASPEIRFYIDSETHDPIEVQAKKIRETNSMVEEFMLLANVSVAEKIYREFPEYAVLRRHPTPPISNFDPLIKVASQLVSKNIHCVNDTTAKCNDPDVVGFRNEYIQQ